MLPWTLTDSDAKNIYTAMCNWYNSPSNLPNRVNDTGVFFGFDNFTRDKLWYCIEYLRKRYGLGWFSDDYTQRKNALNQIAAELYQIFDGQVDEAGILKFLNWVYNFAKNDADAVKYFSEGGGFSVIDTISKVFDTKVATPTKNAVENVSYGLTVPSLKSLMPDYSSLLKLGLIVGGGIFLVKFLENRTRRI